MPGNEPESGMQVPVQSFPQTQRPGWFGQRYPDATVQVQGQANPFSAWQATLEFFKPRGFAEFMSFVFLAFFTGGVVSYFVWIEPNRQEKQRLHEIELKRMDKEAAKDATDQFERISEKQAEKFEGGLLELRQQHQNEMRSRDGQHLELMRMFIEAKQNGANASDLIDKLNRMKGIHG